jgi:hypothetical protein
VACEQAEEKRVVRKRVAIPTYSVLSVRCMVFLAHLPK